MLGKKWRDWTDYEKKHLYFWIITFYLLIGVIEQGVTITGIVCEIILWPLFL